MPLPKTFQTFAEFEREIIRERVNAGLARAKAQGKRLGRPRRDDPKLLANIRKLRKQKLGILKIAKQLGVGTSTVQRIVTVATRRRCRSAGSLSARYRHEYQSPFEYLGGQS